MYLIERMKTLISVTDPDSSDFILASFFLDPAVLNTEKITLNEIESKTFVSMSTINRFCKDCGAANLKSFASALRSEYEELTLYMEQRRGTPSLPAAMKESAEKAASLIAEADRVFFYGNLNDIHQLNTLQNACVLKGILPVILSAWQLARVRKLLEEAHENDCLILIDSGYSLPMLKLRMDLEEEVIPFHELTQFGLHKIFTGRFSPEESDTFIKIPLPSEKNGISELLTLSAYLQKRILNI